MLRLIVQKENLQKVLADEIKAFSEEKEIKDKGTMCLIKNITAIHENSLAFAQTPCRQRGFHTKRHSKTA